MPNAFARSSLGSDNEERAMIAWFLGTKIGRILMAIGAFILAILGAVLYGRSAGKKEQKQHDAAADQEANQKAAKQSQNAIEDRQHVDSEVSALPDAAPQQVATADPSTAAGKLRDDGWVQ
jgi:hypothetical protein